MGKRSAEDIKSDLVSKWGLSEDDIKNMGYSELLSTLKNCEQISNDLDKSIEVVEESSIETVTQNAISTTEPFDSDVFIKQISDHEWTKKALELLEDDELIEGCPTVDGLRRLAEKLFGPFAIYTSVEDCPSIANNNRATVVVVIDFERFPFRKTSGAADVFIGNTQMPYSTHPVATAESRAEGRALRKALRLTKVISAEENLSPSNDEMNEGISEIISGNQIAAMMVQCDRLSVDPIKMINHMGFNTQSVETLNKKQAMQVIQELGCYGRKEKDIPDVIKR